MSRVSLSRPDRSVSVLPLILFVSALIPFGLLVSVMEPGTVYAVGLFVALVFAYLGWTYYVTNRNPTYEGVFAARMFAVTMLTYFVVVGVLGWVRPSPVAFVHIVAIALIFVYYWFIALAAVYHDYRDASLYEPSPPYPSITVLVPAYNEEGYVGRTIRALLDATYPDEKYEIIVIDDGSEDGTYAEAAQFSSESVTVVRKKNGGKYSALNYGLLFASGDIIVTVDADSIVETDALRNIVAPFTNADVGAVASNVTLWNRDSLLTRCQQLEYTIGANIYRRMLDLFGIVLIVPGCLGAFRRDAMEEVFAYDPETLTEDFDLTVKVLRSGYDVTVSDARVYTEAPDTWRDLYNQRLRWYRGNYMTVLKHLDVARDSSYGLLHRLAFPIRLVEMFFVPIASWVILSVIVWLLLTGFVVQVAALFVFFTSIIFLIAALAVHIEGEDWRLLVYTPLFVVGYKHVLDALAAKCCFDVFFRENLEWTRPERIEQKLNRERVEGGSD